MTIASESRLFCFGPILHSGNASHFANIQWPWRGQTLRTLNGCRRRSFGGFSLLNWEGWSPPSVVVGTRAPVEAAVSSVSSNPVSRYLGGSSLHRGITGTLLRSGVDSAVRIFFFFSDAKCTHRRWEDLALLARCLTHMSRVQCILPSEGFAFAIIIQM